MKKISAILCLSATILATGVIAAGDASAHVTVAAPGVTVGASDAGITVHAPNEEDPATTVELKVFLPTDHPIAGVLVQPKPGWSATITQTKLATPISTDDGDITDVVSEIDWKADEGQGIQPGFVGDFTLVAGKLPDDVATLTFKALQTYSNGDVVSWIEVPAAGAPTPDHPAPVLQLAAGGADSAAPAAGASASTGTSSDHTVAWIGVGLAAVALLVALAGVLIVLRRWPAPMVPSETRELVRT